MSDQPPPSGWTGPGQVVPGQPAAGSPKKPWYRRKVGIAAIVIVVLVALAAVAGGGSGGGSSTASSSPTDAPAAATAGATTEPEPTEEPAGPASYEIGTPATVDGLQITILEASYWRGGQFQEPASGSVFVAYKVEVKALDGDKFVSSSDFSVATDDGKQGQFAIVIKDEWEPSLVLNEVKEGNSLTGWMSFEVPEPAKAIVLSYTSNMFSDEVDATWSMACCGK